MINLIKKQSLHWRFMLAPLLGVLLTIALASLFFFSTMEQRESLVQIQKDTLNSSKVLSHLSSRLANNHARVYELLKFAADDGDESRLYDMGKPLLNEVHKIEAEILGAMQGVNISSHVLAALIQYRKKIITAVTMSTVDLLLANKFMAQASSEFNLVNAEFLQLHENMQNSLERQLMAFNDALSQQMQQYARLFLTTVLLVIAISYWLSKLLSRDINHSIDTLSQLTSNTTSVEHLHMSETAQLTQVIHHVRKRYEELKNTQEALTHKESQLRAILNNMIDGIISIDEKGQIESFNQSAEAMFGYSANEVIGQNIAVIMSADEAKHHDDYVQRYIQSAESHIIGIGREVVAMRKDKTVFPMQLSVTELPYKGIKKRCFIGACKDLTYIKQQEELLRRSNKMEALGKLTGGIAHDYNNMLGVVIGYADILAEALQDQPKNTQYIEKIIHATERGIKLTSKLMSFSRQKPLEAVVLNISDLLHQERHMLETTMTVRIKLVFDLASHLWPVNVDSGELEDAILNLCINAKHAMDDGGVLSLKTENIRVQGADAALLDLSPGNYVVLTITDDGLGMSNEVIEKIFDPFYSTKGEAGTGLGLSQVYGFVERSGGTIKVYSEADHGTRFSLYFPCCQGAGEVLVVDKATPKMDTTGDETILLVDDEVELLNLCATTLQGQGYHILKADSAALALKILSRESVDLMFSDIIMPEMDGIALAKIVQQQYPAVKILLTSGFTDNRQKNLTDKSLYENLVYKPYHSQLLLSKLRTLLNT